MGWACPAAVTGAGYLAKLIASDQSFTSLIRAVLTRAGHTGPGQIHPAQLGTWEFTINTQFAGCAEFSVQTLLRLWLTIIHSSFICMPCFWHCAWYLCRDNYTGEKDTTLCMYITFYTKKF